MRQAKVRLKPRTLHLSTCKPLNPQLLSWTLRFDPQRYSWGRWKGDGPTRLLQHHAPWISHAWNSGLRFRVLGVGSKASFSGVITIVICTPVSLLSCGLPWNFQLRLHRAVVWGVPRLWYRVQARHSQREGVENGVYS